MRVSLCKGLVVGSSLWVKYEQKKCRSPLSRSRSVWLRCRVVGLTRRDVVKSPSLITSTCGLFIIMFACFLSNRSAISTHEYDSKVGKARSCPERKSPSVCEIIYSNQSALLIHSFCFKFTYYNLFNHSIFINLWINKSESLILKRNIH